MTTTPETAAPANVTPLPLRLDRREWLLAAYQQMLSHDLPNSLVSIQSLARLVLDDPAAGLDAGNRELLQRLADLAGRTDRKVRTLAEIGRLDRDAGRPEPVPLTDAVTEAVVEVKLLFSRPPVEYIIQQPMPTAVVPRRALQAVLHHLLRNATRAVQDKPGARIEVAARTTPDGVELSIADNGCGLSAARQLRLFEPFQVDTAAEGQGLGLFLVRQVVAGWQGAVRVRSELGQGATFTIRLP